MTFQMPIASPIAALLQGSRADELDVRTLCIAADALAARNERDRAIAMVDAIYALLGDDDDA